MLATSVFVALVLLALYGLYRVLHTGASTDWRRLILQPHLDAPRQRELEPERRSRTATQERPNADAQDLAAGRQSGQPDQRLRSQPDAKPEQQSASKGEPHAERLPDRQPERLPAEPSEQQLDRGLGQQHDRQPEQQQHPSDPLPYQQPEQQTIRQPEQQHGQQRSHQHSRQDWGSRELAPEQPTQQVTAPVESAGPQPSDAEHEPAAPLDEPSMQPSVQPGATLPASAALSPLSVDELRDEIARSGLDPLARQRLMNELETYRLRGSNDNGLLVGVRRQLKRQSPPPPSLHVAARPRDEAESLRADLALRDRQLAQLRQQLERAQPAAQAEPPEEQESPDSFGDTSSGRVAGLSDPFDRVPRRDDLRVIQGIGKRMERVLNDLGVTTFAQLAAFEQRHIDRVADQLKDGSDDIEAENWVGQARELLARRRRRQEQEPG